MSRLFEILCLICGFAVIGGMVASCGVIGITAFLEDPSSTHKYFLWCMGTTFLGIFSLCISLAGLFVSNCYES